MTYRDSAGAMPNERWSKTPCFAPSSPPAGPTRPNRYFALDLSVARMRSIASYWRSRVLDDNECAWLAGFVAIWSAELLLVRFWRRFIAASQSAHNLARKGERAFVTVIAG